MGIFTKPETRSSIFTEEEQHALISMLPGFTGLDERVYVGAEAIKNSDVFTAVKMISSDIASLRLEHLVDEIKTPGDPLLSLFNVKPNQYYTAYQLKFILVANALLNGQSYAEIVRSPRGVPIAIYHINNSKVTYKQDETTGYQLIYEYQESPGKLRKIPKENILHMKFFSLDGIKGESPLLSLEDDLTTQKNSKRFLSNFFKNGTQSGGLLKYKGGKLAKEAREKLRDEWQTANSGTDKAHKVLVLDETMEYEPIEVDTEILKLVNTSTHSTIQVAKAFGIPRHKFGLETSNMNLEQMNLDYLINTLSPYLESFTAELNFKCIPDADITTKRYWFDTDNQRIIDAETKSKIIKEDLAGGLISLNEARRRKGYPPIEGDMGDKHLISLNFTTLEMIEEYQMAKAKNMPLSKGGEDNGE